jgi:NAD(P)-dependent dehydrogenase (short-subunit alcohol dehydrogenase family)
MLLDGKVAVVTGSGLGIGRAHAIALAQAGARVVVNSRTASDVTSVVAKIRHTGGHAVGCVASVASVKGAQQIIQTAINRFGRIDVLVNNAGINRRGTLVDLSEQDFDEIIAINLKGQFLCAQAAVPYMIKQRWGRIINMSSNAIGGSRQGAAYAASKAGVLALSLSWALELAEYGITCNAIRAHAHTRMTQESTERARQTAQSGGTLPRDLSYYVLPPEAASPLVVFLASDLSGKITGQFIGIDGPRLILYSRIRPVSVAIIPNGWTVELLQKHFKTTVGRQLQNYDLSLS